MCKINVIGAYINIFKKEVKALSMLWTDLFMNNSPFGCVFFCHDEGHEGKRRVLFSVNHKGVYYTRPKPDRVGFLLQYFSFTYCSLGFAKEVNHSSPMVKSYTNHQLESVKLWRLVEDAIN